MSFLLMSIVTLGLTSCGWDPWDSNDFTTGGAKCCRNPGPAQPQQLPVKNVVAVALIAALLKKKYWTQQSGCEEVVV